MKNGPLFLPFEKSPAASIMISTLMFSFMGVAVKLLPHLPAYELVFFRSLTVCLVAFLLLKQARVSPWGNNRKWLITRGVVGTIGLVTFFYTLQYMPLASAVTVQYLSPLFTAAFGTYLLKEKMRPYQIGCFLLAFTGVLLIKGYDPRISVGILAVGIVSAATSGFVYAVIRKLRNSDAPLVVVFYFSLVTILMVGPYAAFHWVPVTNPQDWILIVAIGLLAYLAQYYMTVAYQGAPAASVALLVYLGTGYGLFFGWWLWDEGVPPLALAGIFLILVAVITHSLMGGKRIFRRKAAPPAPGL